MRPLHQPLYGQQGEKAVKSPKNPDRKEEHPGLWYDKFCHQWSRVHDRRRRVEEFWWLGGTGKKKWMEEVVGKPGHEKPVGEKGRITEATCRLRQLVENRSGRWLYMKTTSRWVTGLGRPHPVENGFAWHPTLGTPYLPGSSVKGMVRAWAKECGKEADKIRRWLGPEPEENRRKVGEWIFFDALPLEPVELEVDIMTPHYGAYYDRPEKNPPFDGYHPVPIPFLTVAKDQKFVFAVAPRQATAGTEENGKEILNWIKEALEWMGAGAKTAVGYGRFEKDDEKKEEEEKKRQEEQKQAGIQREREKLPKIKREMMEDGYDGDHDRFMEAMKHKWLPRLSKETPMKERVEIAGYLKEWYQKHKPGYWEKPKNSKNKEKVSQIKAVLQERT
ncbi:type III-B CRISPR module RAMP protein Cmr6 [Paludifilum halophilum]|uniref:Type III-B CRISPR module RAMP protein Cmr6 n=1 Tax=Paludifilum halophilum TaxID=1642702 RepID=A0A235B2Q7_9BACL|nr:type III-B CRISPR module RAMP protein Cmr6 [Paludifilum halophilum]OYD06588.1 type III-B CRISPR module RAMP protein Cmr6 [Paludifilum halophilum]